MKLGISSLYGTTSILSPPSSSIIGWILIPFLPTKLPTGSIFSSFDQTATFVLLPASLAIPFISTIPSIISGTSNSNSFLTKFGSFLDKTIWGPNFPDSVTLTT